MTYLVPIVLLAAGAYFLYKGAGLLIENASKLAQNLGIPLVFIGFTIVALGTSLPELIVGIIAGIQGNNGIVIGNILGSNAANAGLILGLAALLLPKALPPDRHPFETASFVVATAILYTLSADGIIGRTDGAVLIAAGIVYSVLLVRYHRRTTQLRQIVERVITVQHRKDRVLNVVALAAGFGLMFIGARMMVENAVEIATTFGVSEVIIGLTAVALGTSLPEIFTTVIAIRRRHTGLIVSNVLGSNILNILVVLGVTALIAPISVSPSFIDYDLPMLTSMCLLVYFLLRKGRKLTAWNGVLLIAFYFGYIAFAFVIRTGLGLILGPVAG